MFEFTNIRICNAMFFFKPTKLREKICSTGRNKMKITILLTVCIFMILPHVSLYADDNICWVQAPLMDDVWVIVYDESRDGDRGDVIYKGKIKAGEKVKIVSTQGRVRYQYKKDDTQPYGGDTSTGCFGGRSFFAD